MNQALRFNKNGTLQPFYRDKLFLSIYDSLKHRKTAQMDATALADTIIGKLHSNSQGAGIERDYVADVTYKTLKLFDQVAATHYKAFHP